MAFDYSRNYRKLNLRANPDLYRVGIGEQGVLLVEPYKSEILPITNDPVKAKSAEIFKAIWDRVEADPLYATLKADWKAGLG